MFYAILHDPQPPSNVADLHLDEVAPAAARDFPGTVCPRMCS